MRDKCVEERFPLWSAAGHEMDVSDSGCNGVAISGKAIADEHNRTVDALCDAVRRLNPEQQAEWLAAWPHWRPSGTRQSLGPVQHVPVLAGVSFVAPPPSSELAGLATKLAQLVTNIARERSRRLEAAVVECMQREQRVQEIRIHQDAGGIEQRAELIVAGKVAATVDLSDLDPKRLMRDSGKPPA